MSKAACLVVETKQEKHEEVTANSQTINLMEI
jgi:hypothetical protein